MKHFFASALLFALLTHDGWAQEPELSDDIPEVVIIGTRSERPLKDATVPVRVVHRKDTQAAGDTTAAEAVSRVVGVQIDTTTRTGQTPQIQGFGSKHVLVLVDGRRVTGRLADDFDLSRIPVSSIERIEVLKGASSVLYGSDAIGGVINIVTRKPRQGLHGETQLSRDTLNRNEAGFSVSGGNDRVTARLNANHQKGPSFDLDPKDIATTGNAYERNIVQFQLNGKITPNLNLSTKMEGDETTTNGISIGAGNSVIDMKTKGQGRTAAVGGTYFLGDASEVRIDLGESRRKYELLDDQREGTASDRHLTSKEITHDGSAIVSSRFTPGHETTAGVEVSDQTFSNNQIRNGSKSRTRESLFAQHEWSIVPHFRIAPGLRYDVDSQFDEQLSKALAIRFDPNGDVIIRTSYGEGYRAPSFSELYLSFANQARGYRVEGNPNLTPERSRSIQSSVAWQATTDLWFSLGVFTNKVHDLIGTVRSQPADVLLIDYANIDSVLTKGIETAARANINKNLSLGFDYTFLEARDEANQRMLEGRAMHSGSIQTRYEDVSGFSAAIAMGLVGRRPFYTQTPTGLTTDWARSYRSVNLRLAQNFGETFEVFGGVKNLTNETQEKFTPVPPRAYFGGVSAEL